MLKDELKFIKDEYKNKAKSENKHEFIQLVSTILLQMIADFIVIFFKICVVIFFTILYAPLFMFCNTKKRKWRI